MGAYSRVGAYSRDALNRSITVNWVSSTLTNFSRGMLPIDKDLIIPYFHIKWKCIGLSSTSAQYFYFCINNGNGGMI